jgi:nuclear factor erythroid 2
MDLIEVLWKQDVDLGFSLDLFNPSKPEGEGKAVRVEDDDIEKLKALEALKKESPKDTTKVSEQLSKNTCITVGPPEQPCNLFS